MFGIVFVTLRVWVYKPVLGLLQKRREMMEQWARHCSGESTSLP